jgi:cytochrome c
MYKALSLSFLALTMLSACRDSTRDDRLRAAGPNPSFEALMKVADAQIGAKKFMRCAGCHQIEKSGHDLGGPNLYGIFNQPTAQSSTRFGFTAAVRDSGLIWDAPTLDKWIKNPKAVIPATSMQFGGVPDALDRADIIAFIRTKQD